jgi:hypothetical protein
VWVSEGVGEWDVIEVWDVERKWVVVIMMVC